MSRRYDNPIVAVWKFFKQSRVLKQKAQQTCVGVDDRGNKYYIQHANKEHNIRESRYVLPPDKDQQDIVPLPRHVPPQWDAWLRGRRQNPPSEEELYKVELEKLKVQQRVKEREMQERLGTAETAGATEEQKKDTANLTKTIEGDTRKKSFPTYDDLEKYPGERRGEGD